MKPLTTRTLNGSFDAWLHRIIDEAFRATGSQAHQNGWDWLTHCGYFMTMTFDRAKIARYKAHGQLGNRSTSLEFDTFHGTYVEIVDSLVGKRWQKGQRRTHWPLAVVAVDFDGTRYSKQTEFTGRNVHLHAIWVVHPDTKADFEAIVGEADALAKFQTYGALDAIEFLPFDATKFDLSYLTKAYVKTVVSPSSVEMMRIYPSPRLAACDVHWKLIHTYPKMTRELKRLRLFLRKERITEREHLRRYPNDRPSGRDVTDVGWLEE